MSLPTNNPRPRICGCGSSLNRGLVLVTPNGGIKLFVWCASCDAELGYVPPKPDSVRWAMCSAGAQGPGVGKLDLRTGEWLHADASLDPNP